MLSMPATSSALRMTFSALGDRHIFPQHTKSSERMAVSEELIEEVENYEGILKMGATLARIQCFIHCGGAEIELIFHHYDRSDQKGYIGRRGSCGVDKRGG